MLCMAVAAFCNSTQGQKLDLQNFTQKSHWDVALLLVENNREMKHALKEETINLMRIYCKFSAFHYCWLSLGISQQWNGTQRTHMWIATHPP